MIRISFSSGSVVGTLLAFVLCGVPVWLSVGCGPAKTPDGKIDIREDIFEQGRLAGKAGLARESNPYPDGGDNWDRARRSKWFTGFNVGDAERLVEERDRKYLDERHQRAVKAAP